MTETVHKDIVKVALDEKTVIKRSPDIEHERRVALYDLMEENHFRLTSGAEGPFHITMGMQEGRLALAVSDGEDNPIEELQMPMMPMKKIIKDYFTVCESYFQAIRSASPSQIESIDMGRRGLHNEAAEMMRERLQDRVEMDLDTARRLFTLVCVLQIRG